MMTTSIAKKLRKTEMFLFHFNPFSLNEKSPIFRWGDDAKAGISKWTFPDVVKAVKKTKRCKAARRAKEEKAFMMWNPMEQA